MQEIYFTNTLTRKKERFEPIEPGRVKMYACGPTVYNLIHIGNLRAALVADLVYRYLKYAGYEVSYVRNYTDIDDKIIQKAIEDGVEFTEITKKYISEVEKDYAVTGLLEPDHKTLATEHIPEMIEMIQKIIDHGKGYVAEDGEVFFSIQDFEGYGKLSHKNLEDLIAGARVGVRENKKNPMDFSLWKPAKPGEPSWKTPWSDGRPGWHIECSVMATKWLGEQIDIHMGGVDLIFPHHENEIAQSEAACGKAPFSKYWIHNEHLTLDKEKMSKSLGNTFIARDFLTQYGGEVARYLLLSVHYGTKMDFSDQSVEEALSELERLYEAKKTAVELLAVKAALPDLRAESLWGEFVAGVEQTRKEIQSHYANDLNTPGALGALFSLIRKFNRTLSEKQTRTTPSAVMAAQSLVDLLEGDIGAVIGVGRLSPDKALSDLQRIRKERASSGGESRPSEEEIQTQIEERIQARKEKNFARADEIRDELARRGVEIKDSPQGTTWSYR